jgi:uncharacterized lipoprotein
MTAARFTIAGAVLTLLGGCHWFRSVAPDCHQPQEYQRARQVAPLRVPAGLDSPNVQSALVIPDIGVAPPSPGPKEACLDAPPRYKAAPVTKAAGG